MIGKRRPPLAGWLAGRPAGWLAGCCRPQQRGHCQRCCKAGMAGSRTVRAREGSEYFRPSGASWAAGAAAGLVFSSPPSPCLNLQWARLRRRLLEAQGASAGSAPARYMPRRRREGGLLSSALAGLPPASGRLLRKCCRATAGSQRPQMLQSRLCCRAPRAAPGKRAASRFAHIHALEYSALHSSSAAGTTNCLLTPQTICSSATINCLPASTSNH